MTAAVATLVLVFGSVLPFPAVAGWALLAFLLCFALIVPVQSLMKAAGLPAPDLSVFAQLLEGNLSLYLWMLIPVSWGSAAIGEELLARGFLQHRLTGLTGRYAALVLQALIFAVAHFYQGLSGIIQVFVVGLVFGAVRLRTHSLLPTILAHGAIDTLSITLLYLGYVEWLEF